MNNPVRILLVEDNPGDVYLEGRFATVPVVVTSSSPSMPTRLDPEHLGVPRCLAKEPDLEESLKIGGALKEILIENHARGAGL